MHDRAQDCPTLPVEGLGQLLHLSIRIPVEAGLPTDARARLLRWMLLCHRHGDPFHVLIARSHAALKNKANTMMILPVWPRKVGGPCVRYSHGSGGYIALVTVNRSRVVEERCLMATYARPDVEQSL